jgi:transcriptional regulator GlxA family with amidase domain
MAKSDTHRIGVLAYTGCSAWITAGLLEFFAIANVAARLQGVPFRFDHHAIGAGGRTVRASQGVRIPTRTPQRRYDAIVVPPLWSDNRDEFTARIGSLRRLNSTVKDLAARSGILASACSGAVLLAQAGLLDGYRATTCWWLAEWFALHYPDVRLDASRLVVIDGRRWTAAAGTAYLHLCLELTREFAGEHVAALAGRLALVEPKRGSQSPFLAATEPAGSSDPLVEQARQAMLRQIANPISIATLARRLGTTDRTLHRRFRDRLGLSPLAYVQSQRIARAKQLLGEGRLSLEAIVERCGYSDPASFRKLFTREVGMSPREYRSRFGR